MPSFSARIRGQVQGVGFRAYAAIEARALGLAGFAANRPDGSVEIYAEGRRADLDRMIALLRRGPRAARVEACEVTFGDGERRLKGFEIH